MNKKALIFLIILAAVAGGFFYLWEVWIPAQIKKEIAEKEREEQLRREQERPRLFSKEDYKIEERGDGKYIVVEKVGLTAKVPEGWKSEIKGDDVPEPEYWINIFSPDTEISGGIVAKGCGVSIMAETAKETVETLKKNITLIQENPQIKAEEISLQYKDYILEVVKISNHQALKWIGPENPKIGQGAGVEIPLQEDRLISLATRFPLGYKEKCFLIWEDFLKNVVIE